MYTGFGDVARYRIGMQAQYCRHYLDATQHPEIAEGIRWKGDPTMYHSLEIHVDDVETFVERVVSYRKVTGQI